MKKKGFTLIDLIAVLVILAIIALVVTPLVMNIIRNSKESVRKRSIENYGKAIEIAITSYLLDNGNFPTKVSQLNIEYSGSKVECSVEHINDDTSIYLEGCKVNGRLVENYTYGIDKRTAVEVLLSKTNSINITNYNDGDKGEMYTFEHVATEQTPVLTDYRYIGNVPNNYVTFNNGEVWRIIGVFSVDDGTGKYEKRMKLIRSDSIGNMAWNSSNINDWVGSTMQVYLNDTYTLDDESSGMIDVAKYYLGGRANSSGDGQNHYTSERSEAVYSSDRSNRWVGNIALMYPSDYIYTYALGVDNKCYSNPGACDQGTPLSGWIYSLGSHQWALTNISSSASKVFVLFNGGSINHYYNVNTSSAFGTRPVVYLKPEVRIKQGDGTLDNPYIFEL